MIIPRDSHIAPIVGAYFEPCSGSAYYRLTVPVGVLGGAVAPFYGGVTQDQRAAAACIVVSCMSARLGGDLDALRALIKTIKGDGRRYILDLDDDHRNQEHAKRRANSNIPALMVAAREADAVVCTNDTLARRLRDFNADIRILPNLVRLEHWLATQPPRTDGPIVIVLAGSSTHAQDWKIVAPALTRLKVVHGSRVRIRTVGYRPTYLPVDEHVPWRSLDVYPQALRGAHIGLCPLPDTHFNRAKSPVKAYEYALSGACAVGSPCQYGPVLRAAGLGTHVIPDGGDWYPILDRLVRSAAERSAAHRALLAHVRTLDAHLHTDHIRAAYAA